MKLTILIFFPITKEKINFFCWVCFQCAENDRDGSIANRNIVGIEEGGEVDDWLFWIVKCSYEAFRNY